MPDIHMHASEFVYGDGKMFFCVCQLKKSGFAFV